MLATQSNIELTDVENVFLPFGKNALSRLAFSMSVNVIASQQMELRFSCVASFGAAHFLFFPKGVVRI